MKRGGVNSVCVLLIYSIDDFSENETSLAIVVSEQIEYYGLRFDIYSSKSVSSCFTDLVLINDAKNHTWFFRLKLKLNFNLIKKSLQK